VSTSVPLSNELHYAALVGAVPDPELGDVTIGELGMLNAVEWDGSQLRVILVPTFLGCPARSVIELQVVSAVAPTPVTITWSPSSWVETMIDAAGRAKLAALGIAVGDAGCPRCGAALAATLVPGPTSCRSAARCTGCGDVVEVIRGAASPIRFRGLDVQGISYANV
jgi:ring-1,2-phenylacetyl-CoA epoxidase subunit PaaD